MPLLHRLGILVPPYTRQYTTASVETHVMVVMFYQHHRRQQGELDPPLYC